MTERCVKCEGAMKEGFQVDHARNRERVGLWAEGAPEFGLFRILRMKGRRTLPIRTLRCTRCGYLESYAPEPRS